MIYRTTIMLCYVNAVLTQRLFLCFFIHFWHVLSMQSSRSNRCGSVLSHSAIMPSPAHKAPPKRPPRDNQATSLHFSCCLRLCSAKRWKTTSSSPAACSKQASVSRLPHAPELLSPHITIDQFQKINAAPGTQNSSVITMIAQTSLV